MGLVRRVAGLLLLFALMPLALAQEVQVNGLRLWEAPDHTRIVLDLSQRPDFRLFLLDNPARVVVDLDRSRVASSADLALRESRVVKGMRHAVRNGDGLRLVFDLGESVRPQSFTLPPNQEYGNRLVIDLHREAGGAAASASSSASPSAAATTPPASARAPAPAASAATRAPTRSLAQSAARDVIIAIDAGHGGEDPGAIGPGGTREKDVVLAIAQRLQRLVDAEPGMRAVMVRSGDYYIPLRDRFARARDARADILISIHADAFPDRRVRGSSIYALSTRGATSEAARMLAQRENAADLVGGVSLRDKDEVLRSVLLDLSQSATIEHSLDVGDHILRELKRVGRVHKPRVEQANFAVLRAPDIPSVLVEAAFISNPDEERRLRDARYQQNLAEAMLAGVRSYFRSNPPAGSVIAQHRSQQHVIQRGESLSTIARRYRVSVEQLRAANNLNGDRIRIGDVLQVPAGG